MALDLSSSVVKLNPQELKERINSGDLILVDFWAEWCMPCRNLEPLLDSLSAKYQGSVTIGKLEISKFQETAVEHSISNIPTLLIFKGGKEIERVVGLRGMTELDRLIAKHTKGS
jgi:thioredoxin 1